MLKEILTFKCQLALIIFFTNDMNKEALRFILACIFLKPWECKEDTILVKEVFMAS